MGILSFLGIGGEAPRMASELAPTIDLERGVFCELGREDNWDSVTKRLGTPTKRPKQGVLYDQIGLHVGVAKLGRVSSWSVMFDDAARELWTWLPARTNQPPGEAELVAKFGPPTNRETDEDEHVLTWERERMHLIASFALDGKLNDVFVDYV